LQLPENPAAPPLPTLSRKTSDLPLLEWCSIPAGQVIFSYVDAQNQAQSVARAEEAFYISKYPVTNGLYHGFLKDSKGYANVDLWSFSNEAYQWYLANGTPKPSKFQGDDRPREMLNWYEAMVFCLWLSQRLEKHIRLPTLYEWQRAFQGDDQRPYPWGHKFEPTHCNTLESRLKMTSVVTRYAQGVSPFGVYDLAGNVWEWCLNLDTVGQFEADPKRVGKRIVRGGSFLSPGLRANATSLYALKPEIFHAAIGFRIAYKD
jgi:formylglycine-generating enzyme required for sulfatase activity